MGTITTRNRNDGTPVYKAQVRIKTNGKIVHQETQTFERQQVAKAWITKRETELHEPGALERLKTGSADVTLLDAINRYINEKQGHMGDTKVQILRWIKAHEIANKACRLITSADLVAFARTVPGSPANRYSYLSRLASIFAIARPAWGYPLDQQAMKDAMIVAKRLGIIDKGNERDRRPTIDELDKLLAHFAMIENRRKGVMPMTKIVPFAIFSARRQEEITTLQWADFDKNRIMVRNMKHPNEKAGNNVWCDLVPEAVAYIESMPKVNERIFPFTAVAISRAFTRACEKLGIENLHFHDLRHEGVSRLFEMGRTIPQAASVSGHRSWQNLKRYTHLRQTGDKYAEWKWRKPQAR